MLRKIANFPDMRVSGGTPDVGRAEDLGVDSPVPIEDRILTGMYRDEKQITPKSFNLQLLSDYAAEIPYQAISWHRKLGDLPF